MLFSFLKKPPNLTHIFHSLVNIFITTIFFHFNSYNFGAVLPAPNYAMALYFPLGAAFPRPFPDELPVVLGQFPPLPG
tara:strand:- start:648 stop:881 length:234 start_codon:yes stop_codon:yes gene_type:complete